MHETVVGGKVQVFTGGRTGILKSSHGSLYIVQGRRDSLQAVENAVIDALCHWWRGLQRDVGVAL